MTERFRKRNSFVTCRELLSCDISTAEGAQTASEKKLIKKTCPKIVKDAAELLEEIFAEN